MGRSLDPAALARAVRGLPKAQFEVIFDEHVSDAHTLAMLIWGGLKQAGWNPKNNPVPMGSAAGDIALKGYSGGIMVVTNNSYLADPHSFNPDLPPFKLGTSIIQLIVTGGQTPLEYGYAPDIPDGAYQIIVGSR